MRLKVYSHFASYVPFITNQTNKIIHFKPLHMHLLYAYVFRNKKTVLNDVLKVALSVRALSYSFQNIINPIQQKLTRFEYSITFIIFIALNGHRRYDGSLRVNWRVVIVCFIGYLLLPALSSPVITSSTSFWRKSLQVRPLS